MYWLYTSQFAYVLSLSSSLSDWYFCKRMCLSRSLLPFIYFFFKRRHRLVARSRRLSSILAFRLWKWIQRNPFNWERRKNRVFLSSFYSQSIFQIHFHSKWHCDQPSNEWVAIRWRFFLSPHLSFFFVYRALVCEANTVEPNETISYWQPDRFVENDKEPQVEQMWMATIV